MKKSWLWQLVPCTIALLLHVVVVECRDHVRDANVLPDISGKPLLDERGHPQPSHDNANVGSENERVISALKILSEAKVPVAQPAKPLGVVGYMLHFGKELLRILIFNNPEGRKGEAKLNLHVARAVKELKLAAEQDQDPDAMFLLAEMNFYGNFSHPRDFKQAFHWYERLASLDGNHTAQYMLGFMYATGIGGAVERDQAKALMYHTFAAESGNTRSEMTLAYRSHVGIGTPRDCDQATNYYKRVADKAIEHYRSGPPGGHRMISESYRWADEEGGVYGEGASISGAGPAGLRDGSSFNIDADLEDLLEYLDLMSRKGELQYTYSLGRVYYDGARTLPRNFRRAMRYFKQVTRRYWNKDGSVNPNHPANIDKLAAKAAGYIGLMYLRGEGVDQNFAHALTWFKRGLANGNALCQHEIGLMYLHGYGVTRDAFKAANFFKAAAEQDYPSSETRLGALFLDQGDVATATKYFELAARSGNMEAFYYLAELHNNAVGKTRQCGIAAAYYKMVAERAEAIHSSFSEANAAYKNGDKETALIAAMMAAEQGYENAQANVAYLLDEQRSVLSLDALLPWNRDSKPALLRNAALALIYWTRSSRQANIDSLIKMGDYYLYGIGTARDTEKASVCYQTAAEAYHSPQAYWNLGWMHENGIAVEQDFHMAKRYYDLALATSEDAYLPVKLSLIKLRIRGYWNKITHGKAKPIQDDQEPKPRRSLKEWISAFIENDEQLDAQYRAQLYGQGEADEVLGADGEHRHLDSGAGRQDGYYDELDLDIDESVLEGLIIAALVATLLVLVYLRQQRNRQRPGEDNNGAGAGNEDRGFFPRPGEPDFAQWAAGGVGH